MAGPADRPGDHRPLRRGRVVRGPADRRHPAPDRAGPGRPARPGGRLYFDPDRALADEEEALARAVSGCATARRPGHHRHHDDPGHPRRAAVRPDHRPDRRRPQGARRHRGPRRAPSTRGRDPRRPPTRPGPALRPRGRSTQPGARAGAANLYVHLTPADLAADLDRRAPVPSRSRSSAPPPPGCSPTGSPGSPQPAPRSPSAPSSTSTPRRPSTSTTHPQRCARPWCCATRTVSSPAVAATPGPATSTTSPSTSPWKTADHRAKPGPANLAPLCRTHHRVKTHTAWHYKRLDDGSYVWTAPPGTSTASLPTPRERTALVSSDRSLRSLLDHQWFLPSDPHVPVATATDPGG